MRKWIKIVFWTLLLAGGACICAIRWQAWFGMPQEQPWQGDTLTYRFPSFAQEPVRGFVLTEEGWRDKWTPNSLDILVLGDIHNRLQQSDYDLLAARVPQADLVAQTGDWMDRGQEYYYQSLLREWLPSRLCGLPVIVCPGNHEYSKGVSKELSPVWENAFPQPLNGPSDVPGRHYFVDFPSLRIIVIDTNPLNRLVWLTRTLTWLRETMYSAGDRYLVVLMHHPVLSAAQGRVNPLEYAAFRHALGEADLVIAGHDHSYMRRDPFVILNTAGKPKEQHLTVPAQATDTVPVYAVLSVKEERGNWQKGGLFFKVYRLEDGKQIDELYVHHD